MTRIPAASPNNLEPAGQWLRQAACAGRNDAMFPDNNERLIEEAKQICRGCFVQVECVLDALRTRDNEHGIRGGMKPIERRNLARQIARRAGKPFVEEEPPPPERTLQSLWDERTKADGVHLLWAASTPVYFEGRALTPQRIGFRLDRGRDPVGMVRKACEADGCVLPAHLRDQQERDEQRAAAGRPAAVYSANGRLLAECGTRSAYQRHVKNKEPIDAACRQANSGADNRLRRTGTTRELTS